MPFELESNYQPRGDQAQAIAKLMKSIAAGNRHQTLLGVTGSGKTFTDGERDPRASSKPTLVISHNKTLAAQLYSEFKQFFPRQRGRVFRQLLRLLPARGLHPADGHLHREGFVDQRGDRAAAALHHLRAALAPRRDRGRQRLVHLRPGLAGGLPEHAAHGESRAADHARGGARASWWTCSTSATTSHFARGKFRVRGDVVEVQPASADEEAIRHRVLRR